MYLTTEARFHQYNMNEAISDMFCVKLVCKAEIRFYNLKN